MTVLARFARLPGICGYVFLRDLFRNPKRALAMSRSLHGPVLLSGDARHYFTGLAVIVP